MEIVAEEWRALPGRWAPLKYEVSSLGRIRSLHPRHFKRMCKFGVNHRGYPVVWLSVGHRKYTKPVVHKLVALAFVLGRRPGLQVNHKNGIKTDNSAANLEWVTCKENIRHAIRTGLRTPSMDPKCFELAKKNRRFSDEVAATIRKRHAAGRGFNEMAKEYGVAWTTIMKLCTGKTYKTPQFN